MKTFEVSSLALVILLANGAAGLSLWPTEWLAQGKSEAAKVEHTGLAFLQTKAAASVDPAEIPLGTSGQAAADAGGLAHVISNIDEAEKQDKAAKEAAKTAESQAKQEAAKVEKKKPALVHTKAAARVDPAEIPLGTSGKAAADAGGLAHVISNIDEAEKQDKAAKEAAKAVEAQAKPDTAKVEKTKPALVHTKAVAGVDPVEIPLGTSGQAAADAGGLAHVISNIDEAEKQDKAAKEAAKTVEAQAKQEAAKVEKKKPALVHTKAAARVDPAEIPFEVRRDAPDAGGLAYVISNIDEAEKMDKAAKEAAKTAEAQAKQGAAKVGNTKPALVHIKAMARVDPAEVPLGTPGQAAADAGGLAHVISNIDEAEKQDKAAKEEDDEDEDDEDNEEETDENEEEDDDDDEDEDEDDEGDE